MSYDNPQRITYSLGLMDFGGAGDLDVPFQGPPGKTGLVKHVSVGVTEIMAGSSTTPRLQIGTAASPLANFDLDMGTAAADTVVQADEGDAAIIDQVIPADQLSQIRVVAGVGTPTGQGHVFVQIDWV